MSWIAYRGQRQQLMILEDDILCSIRISFFVEYNYNLEIFAWYGKRQHQVGKSMGWPDIAMVISRNLSCDQLLLK